MGPKDPGPLRVPITFTSLYVASKVTGISNNTYIEERYNKNNEKITRRKGEFARYKMRLTRVEVGFGMILMSFL